MPQVSRCVLLCVALVLIMSGCNRSRLPAYNEAEVLKNRQEYYEAMQVPSFFLGFVKRLVIKEGRNVYGPVGSDFADANFPAPVEVERKGSDITIVRVASGAILGGKGVAPNTPAISGTKLPPNGWFQTGGMRLKLAKAGDKLDQLGFYITDDKNEALLHLHQLNW